MEGEGDGGMGEEVGVDDGGECFGNCELKFLDAPVGYFLLIEMHFSRGGEREMRDGDSLIISPTLFVINRGEASNYNADIDGSLVAASSRRSLRPSLTCLLLGLRGAGQHTHDLCVAHLEVGGAIGGGLRANLGVETAKFVPATTVNPEEG